MNIEKNITNELSTIESYITAAKAQYDSQGMTPNSIAPDYHVLFIFAREVVVNDVTYTANETTEAIFREAIDNFKSSVEKFTNQNVHIVPTLKIINDPITINGRSYMIYEDIYPYLQKYSAVGLYDAVLVGSKECGMGGAVTTLGMFQFENIMFGFSHIEIVSSDASKINQGYSYPYPYLTTTNYLIHEWLHQLEGYRGKTATLFPEIDSYGSSSYSWDSTYFDSPSYPNIVEPYLTSFYRAVLAADVTYIGDTSTRKIGMFPLFWKVTPRKVIIGRYIVQSENNAYFFNNNGVSATTTNLSNDMKFVWNIYYSFGGRGLRIKSFNGNTATIGNSISDLKCTRVGPYDEGNYILVNLSLNNKLLSYSESYALEMSGYRTTSRQMFNAVSNSELYYKLSTSQNTNKYLDLHSNNNIEGNTVALGGWTGNATALTWQFRYNGENYKIMPLASATRSLSYYNDALHITSSTNPQNWRPELVANGKYLFKGSYKIKDSNGNYLSYSGNGLKLTSTPTVWNIDESTDNYYYVYAVSGTSRYYIDVANASGSEGNSVGVMPYLTGYTDAQTWKFMLQNNGSVIIVPRLSLNKGIKSTSSNSVLSSNPMSFYLEKI